MSEPSDIERNSLDAHVSLCALRYESLDRRLSSLETRLTHLETLVLEIRDSLNRLPAQQDQRWSRAGAALIGLLLGVTGYLINQALF